MKHQICRTVLAAAADQTIRDVADTAHQNGRKAMADLIGVTDIRKRAPESWRWNSHGNSRLPGIPSCRGTAFMTAGTEDSTSG